MKKLITTFSFFICAQFIISQTVVSSCFAPESIKALYMRDADRLALRKIYAQNLTDTNSVRIPQTHVDTALKALIAVYNATALPARNTVISQYNIHTFPNPNMNRLYVTADSNLAWMHQLRLGNIPTGNTQIDSLISEYHLNMQSYSNYSGFFSYHLITFKSDSSYNLPALAGLFENVSGVFFSEPVSVIGSGGDITASIYTGYVQLVYSLGWGDCLSNCLYWHYWLFNVYDDCSVEYLGEDGTPLPVVSIPTISISGSYCTNETLTVTVSGASAISLNDQPIAVPQFTLSSPTPTSYIILASNYTFPTSTSSVLISITDCGNPVTSIKENKWNFDMSIYPNPANEFIQLQMNDEGFKVGQGHAHIYNQLGQLVKEEEFVFKDGLVKIKTTELENGVYVLNLYLSVDSSVRLNKRFAVNH